MKSKLNTNTVTSGQTVTFYSYKGGVGRSMALVNIACLAAKENKKVLLIDCDLEAPGLHQFFKTDMEAMGFVDFVYDVTSWLNTAENNNEEGYHRFFRDQLDKYISKGVIPDQPGANIKIDLIKAGKFGKDYSVKLGSINWLEFYKKAPIFFRTFACYLEESYDYIFVDARTGLADTSGICTMLMPQKLVLVFALNNQNINGVVDVAGQTIDYRNSSSDYRRLDIYPLPSRIENSVNPNLQQWIENYRDKFVSLFSEKYQLDDCYLSSYFDRSFIQYYPIHAYGENIPALYESATSANFITYNYNNFFTVLKMNIPSWEVISIDDEIKIERLANDQYTKAYNSWYKKRDLNKAIDEFTKAIELDPRYVDAYVMRATIKAEQKKYKEAIDDYNMAIELNPGDDLAYAGRGLAKYELKNYEEAIDDYNMAIELNPNDDASYANRGIAKVSLNKYEEAIGDYNKAIELNPNAPLAYDNRGLAKYELKKYEDAIADHSKAIELNPDDDIAYTNRGFAKAGLNKNEEAIDDYNKAIELNPNAPLAYDNRGLAKYELKKYEDAVADHSKAIELRPDDDVAYNNRGLALYELKKFEEAINDHSRAIELKPHDNVAYINRGRALCELKKFEEAIADQNKAIELKPHDDIAYLNRGIAKGESKKYEEAIDDYNKAIELNPNNDAAYTNRGLANYRLNKCEEAIEDYNTAIKLNPKDPISYNNRADAYRKLKKYKLAIEDNEKAIVLDSTDSENFATKAYIASDMNQPELFYESIQKALELGLDIKKYKEFEPEIINKYLKEPRFLDVLKKFTKALSSSPAGIH